MTDLSDIERQLRVDTQELDKCAMELAKVFEDVAKIYLPIVQNQGDRLESEEKLLVHGVINRLYAAGKLSREQGVAWIASHLPQAAEEPNEPPNRTAT